MEYQKESLGKDFVYWPLDMDPAFLDALSKFQILWQPIPLIVTENGTVHEMKNVTKMYLEQGSKHKPCGQ